MGKLQLKYWATEMLLFRMPMADVLEESVMLIEFEC